MGNLTQEGKNKSNQIEKGGEAEETFVRGVVQKKRARERSELWTRRGKSGDVNRWATKHPAMKRLLWRGVGGTKGELLAKKCDNNGSRWEN